MVPPMIAAAVFVLAPVGFLAVSTAVAHPLPVSQQSASSVRVSHLSPLPGRQAIIASAGELDDVLVSQTAKRELLEAISRLRRSSPIEYEENKSELLQKLAALEAIPSERRNVGGRWSLIYSTSAAPSSSPAMEGVDPLQEAFAAAYKVFFKFAPALAGGRDASFLGASNEQRVDLSRGIVDNLVSIPLNVIGRPRDAATARLRVRGIIEEDARAAPDDQGCAFVITFTESQLDAPFGGLSLTVPLPRPRGTIVSTYSDGRFRVARGGRGTLFVLRRVGDSEQELDDADDDGDNLPAQSS